MSINANHFTLLVIYSPQLLSIGAFRKFLTFCPLAADLSFKGATSTREVTTPRDRAMAASVAYALCIVLCICSLQGAVMASKQKLEIVLYTHEIRAGANATLLLAAGTGQGNFSELGWGSILTLDNYVKEGPAFTSKTLGRFTGFAVLTTTGGIGDGGILGVDQFRFGPGSKYNGSSLTITGQFLDPVNGPWEVIVLGGTGYFRGWSGYAISTPYLPTTVAPDYAFKWHIYISK